MNKNDYIDSNKYELVGILNMFLVVPDTIYLIFKNGDKYYFQHSEDGFKIVDFFEIKEEFIINHIVPLTKINAIFKNKKIYFDKDDFVYVGYQIDDNNCFLGSISDLYDYCIDVNIEDEYLNNFFSRHKDIIKLLKK